MLFGVSNIYFDLFYELLSIYGGLMFYLFSLWKNSLILTLLLKVTDLFILSDMVLARIVYGLLSIYSYSLL